MTELAKAIAFATHCLRWPDVKSIFNGRGTLIYRGDTKIGFFLDNAAELESVLQEFLGKRFFIQANRGTSSLFHWRAIVGVQDLSLRGASWEHAVGVADELWDAVFDACVQAAGMFEKPTGS